MALARVVRAVDRRLERVLLGDYEIHGGRSDLDTLSEVSFARREMMAWIGAAIWVVAAVIAILTDRQTRRLKREWEVQQARVAESLKDKLVVGIGTHITMEGRSMRVIAIRGNHIDTAEFHYTNATH